MAARGRKKQLVPRSPRADSVEQRHKQPSRAPLQVPMLRGDIDMPTPQLLQTRDGHHRHGYM